MLEHSEKSNQFREIAVQLMTEIFSGQNLPNLNGNFSVYLEEDDLNPEVFGTTVFGVRNNHPYFERRLWQQTADGSVVPAENALQLGENDRVEDIVNKLQELDPKKCNSLNVIPDPENSFHIIGGIKIPVISSKNNELSHNMNYEEEKQTVALLNEFLKEAKTADMVVVSMGSIAEDDSDIFSQPKFANDAILSGKKVTILNMDQLFRENRVESGNNYYLSCQFGGRCFSPPDKIVDHLTNILSHNENQIIALCSFHDPYIFGFKETATQHQERKNLICLHGYLPHNPVTILNKGNLTDSVSTSRNLIVGTTILNKENLEKSNPENYYFSSINDFSYDNLLKIINPQLRPPSPTFSQSKQRRLDSTNNCCVLQ